MSLYDLPLDELAAYRSGARTPGDLREFWEATLAISREAAVPTSATPVDTGLPLVDTYDVTFSGFGGAPVRAWLQRPAGASGELPLVVRYQGYGGGRGLPHEIPLWTLAGYACLDVDTRGQGSGWSHGDTPDPVGSTPSFSGFLTRGILDRDDYYYRRVFTDAVLAVDAAASLHGVDATRVAVTGMSQGGGIATAVAALRDDVGAALVDVPFLSDFRRACDMAGSAPYTELRSYLALHRDHVDAAFATLAYFDASVLAAWASAPTLFSVALMDRTCPPSTVYAAYNSWAGPKDIEVYPYNDHEGGGVVHEVRQLAWLRENFPA